MSTSLKVVNIAVSFFTATKRLATVLRKEVILMRSLSRPPCQPLLNTFTAVGKPLDRADNTSCFVMRPSFPFPLNWFDLILFSAIILAAAILGVPVAYVEVVELV